MTAALELFINRLPRKPYCTDDYSQGVVIRSKKHALEKSHIQYNHPKLIQALVFDIDKPLSVYSHSFADVAPPNISLINPENGHAHLIYVLEKPVVNSEAGRIKPLKFCASIEASYAAALMADPGYSHSLVKNPIHRKWGRYLFKENPYSLHELADWVDLSPNNVGQIISAGMNINGLGRNCTLFEHLRQFAYFKVRTCWLPNDYSKFENLLLNEAEMVNSSFNGPLGYGEIKRTVRSVACWVWKKFTPEEFRNIQRHRSAAASQKRKLTADERAKKVHELIRRGRTIKEIAIELKIDRSTVYRLLKR